MDRGSKYKSKQFVKQMKEKVIVPPKERCNGCGYKIRTTREEHEQGAHHKNQVHKTSH